MNSMTARELKHSCGTKKHEHVEHRTVNVFVWSFSSYNHQSPALKLYTNLRKRKKDSHGDRVRYFD